MKMRIMDLVPPEYLAVCIQNERSGVWNRQQARRMIRLAADQEYTRLVQSAETLLKLHGVTP